MTVSRARHGAVRITGWSACCYSLDGPLTKPTQIVNNLLRAVDILSHLAKNSVFTCLSKLTKRNDFMRFEHFQF